MDRNKTVIAVFIIMLLAASVMFFLPADKESFERENRSISEAPVLSKESFFSGGFSKAFESFVDDSISFRSKLTDISHFISDNKGIAPPDGKIVYTNKDIGTETVKKACMLIVKDKMMEVFQKDQSSEKKYAEAINHIAENVNDNINIYSMLIPTQLEFGESIYKNIQSNQKKTIEEIYDMLNPRVKSIDVYSALESHTDEYIYYRSDHHWTMLGSYYGYSAFMKAQGLAPASILNFEENEIDGFLGHLYEQYPDENVKANPDKIIWYDTEENADLDIKMIGSNKDGSAREYSCPMFDKTKKEFTFFFTSDHPYTIIKNKEIPNNKTLLVIKDSFANNFVPWCVNNYENIIMVDPRTYKGNLRDVFSKNKIDDVLILNYIFTTSFEDYCDKMINIFR